MKIKMANFAIFTHFQSTILLKAICLILILFFVKFLKYAAPRNQLKIRQISKELNFKS